MNQQHAVQIPVWSSQWAPKPDSSTALATDFVARAQSIAVCKSPAACCAHRTSLTCSTVVSCWSGQLQLEQTKNMPGKCGLVDLCFIEWQALVLGARGPHRYSIVEFAAAAGFNGHHLLQWADDAKSCHGRKWPKAVCHLSVMPRPKFHILQFEHVLYVTSSPMKVLCRYYPALQLR